MYLECIFQVGTKDLLEFRGEDKVALKHIIFFVTLAMFIVAKSDLKGVAGRCVEGCPCEEWISCSHTRPGS